MTLPAAPPPERTHALLNTLCSALGTEHVLTEGDLRAWEMDWRQRERGRALAVVRPASSAEVAAVVRACAAAGVSIVPQGGNTGMVVGSTPDASGTQVVLSLGRMNRVRELDADNLTVTVEAGCVLQTVQQHCAQAGLLYPLRLGSEGSCTVGGNLATNAGGTQVLRYGNSRELCLGLEVVGADGCIWNGLSGLRKDNTGYDLRHLFIGSEGTLGVITAATMRLFPLPALQLTAFATLPSLRAAVQLLGLAHRQLGAALTGFEVMGHFALQLVHKHFAQLPMPLGVGQPDRATHAASPPPYCVVLEVSELHSEARAREQLEQLLQGALETGCVEDAVVAQSSAQGRALWHIRECIPLAQAQEGLNIKHDIALAVSRIPDFVHQTDALLQRQWPGVRLVNYGHLGDGNLHYNVQAPAHRDGPAFLLEAEAAVNTLVYDQVQVFGGSISAEHGIGGLKRHTLAHYKSPVALHWMRGIKEALDPHYLFNPHRVLARPGTDH